MYESQNISENIDCFKKGSQTIYLIGTAHVSRQSADLVEQMIRDHTPDSVAVELCESRYKSLRDPDRWKNMDIISVIRDGKAYLLMTQLALAGFQKRLGNKLQVKPGEEMVRAMNIAEEVGAKTVLADRDIGTTLKRTRANLGIWSFFKVLSGMISGLFSGEELDEKEIERLKKSDALEELMKEFTESFPEVKKSLIDERDQYLAEKIRAIPDNTVVAVVGAGHVPGIKEWINKPIALKELDKQPPPGKLGKIIAWGIPILVLSLIGLGIWNAGLSRGAEMFKLWFWINGFAGAIGSALALAHPVTILTAFLVSPFTSLNPLIAAGWVAGLVEAWIRKPRVSDLENIADEVSSIRGIWNNRVTRILLVIALTNLTGSIGTFLGIGEIASIATD